MLVVSNTSPILNLAIVGRLSLLQQQFGAVMIPQAVLNELRIGENLPGSHSVKKAVEEGWLQVVPVRDRALVRVLNRSLDRGESEAIALAIQVEGGLILLDERDGREIAKSLDFKVTGLLGVLLRAKLDGQLPSLRQAMEGLQQQAGFWIDEALFAALLREGGEARA